MIRLVFPLNITQDSPRPIFKAFINGVSFKCMLDTGADIPVFCKGGAVVSGTDEGYGGSF